MAVFQGRELDASGRKLRAMEAELERTRVDRIDGERAAAGPPIGSARSAGRANTVTAEPLARAVPDGISATAAASTTRPPRANRPAPPSPSPLTMPLTLRYAGAVARLSIRVAWITDPPAKTRDTP